MKHLKRTINFKRNIFLLHALFVLMLLSSCEKVIDLKLNNSEPVIVIEGGVSDQIESQVIRISKTYNFTEANKFNGVSGAKVVLTRDAGSIINYTEVSPGIYKSVQFRGLPGTKYALDVIVDGKTYSASSIMPAKVPIDSLTFRQFNLFGETDTYVSVNYSDPAEIENQYRYILKAKGKVEEDMVSEDRFDDGNKVSNVIFYKLDDMVAGDSVNVEFQCIDRNVYRYFYSLNQNSREGGPPVAPANPASNFNNGALGVFNAYTTSKRTAVIK